MLPRSSFARYALVAAFASLMALALTAPAATAHNDGFNERIVNCVDTRDANSDQCRAALEVSPVDSNFFRVLADNLDNLPAKEEPKAEVDIYALVKECAATRDLESQECLLAMDQSGLSLDEFKAKFAAKLGYFATKEQLSAAAKTCRELMASLNGKHASESAAELSALSDKINYVCHKALVESRMSPDRFWTKYR
jgi:hypothetical protein